ncbi:MAG: cob(I)yrinic acid a,c-diamide adenosyltransferase [Hydrogenophilaceae bacterium]|jgi:cob(I)alamin adenosyltransferase|nr:cob(I)yrinic acid a,c-diamide adenosyltransferase [Hydrogenophilaceae bacterium]
MVTLNKIVTKAGDRGTTRLATGEEVAKHSPRVAAYGAVDETNAAIGVARLHLADRVTLDEILARVQNDLFDLGADLATPERDKPLGFEALRIQESQVDRLEAEVDAINAALAPLTSFILPAGTPAAAHLHLARTIARRAEREVAALMADANERVSPAALKYLNRLSDLLFVAARAANDDGRADVLWTPGATR